MNRIFNVFNHANYGSDTTQETARRTVLPAFNNTCRISREACSSDSGFSSDCGAAWVTEARSCSGGGPFVCEALLHEARGRGFCDLAASMATFGLISFNTMVT